MTSDAQERVVQALTAEHPEDIHVQRDTGPDEDRTVVAFPDGGIVVVGPDGQIIADSRAGREE